MRDRLLELVEEIRGALAPARLLEPPDPRHYPSGEAYSDAMVAHEDAQAGITKAVAAIEEMETLLGAGPKP